MDSTTPMNASEAGTSAYKADVVIYRTPYCGYCVSAARLLQRKGAPFEEVDVSGNHSTRQWLIQATGRRTVPQIFINGRPIGGYDDMATLEREGRLDAMLREAPPEKNRG